MMRRSVVWLWALALAVCALLVATSRYSTDMSVFLPRDPDERQRLLVDQIRDGALSRMILIGIDGGTSAQRADASQRLAGALRTDPAFTGAVNGDAASRERDQALLLGARYVLSPAVTPARFGAEGLHDAIAQTISDLSGSAGLLLKALLPRDPTGELLRVLDQVSGGNTPNGAEGVWASPDGQRALLITMTRAPGTDTDAQEQALGTLRAAFAAANRQGQLTLRMSGSPVFSIDARAAIKSDIHRLSLLGSLGVVTLLLLVYRSLRNVVIGLLPVLSGILAGIAAVSLGFQSVHAITIGFGTTLMGEAVDYSIYYLIQAQDRQAWQQRFWPTVRLGVATSICGFAVLLLSSFPGLAQLGVYSVAGILSAAAVTRLVLPALPTVPVPLARLLRIGQAVDRVRAAARQLRWVAAALALLALGTVVLQRDALWARGLAGLNPAPMHLQQLDAQLRRDAGAPDLQQMVVATAATQQDALALAERVEARLAPLLERGLISRLDSPAHFLPSAATQQARRSALPTAEVLRARLAEAVQGLPLNAERLAPFVQDVEQARNAPPLTATALQGSSFAFAAQTLLLERAHGWSALMPLQLGQASNNTSAVTAIEQALAAPTIGAQDVFYLDLEQQTTRMFGQYLRQALLLVSFGALCIVLLLSLALRRLGSVVRVVLPLAGAVLLVMAAHVLLGVPMTLLHLVGLLLIVAVGSNYTLFFIQGMQERHPAGAPATARHLALASLALANLATMLGFGILAFSQVPVLHALGATVGPGALLALWLSMAWSGAAQARDE
ncbi:MAG: MMPL family transporter [Burkholderiaceae bacterium]|jgi:predicted exporter|nr:MMPL family transporter [Burkholderiaceae bacterium]